jgi:CTP synthase (UTP-ammonia lyase)
MNAEHTRVRIAIVGDFDRSKHSHWATEAALFHAASRLGLAVEPHWLPTSSFAGAGRDSATARLGDWGGVWGAPGSPYASMEGMLRAIEFARSTNAPYLGTCAGFQYALIEFTRNVLGLPDANTAENDPGGANVVITPVECPVPGRPPGTPRLWGTGVARPVPGTLLARLCGLADLEGEYFCTFETNHAFVPRWEAAGLMVAARGGEGEMRALELAGKRFFLATLFQPQLSSSFDQPHPIVEGFLRACAAKAR